MTRIAVKEDRRHFIMGGVVMKEGVEEPWAIDSVVRFTGSSGHREITQNSNTEPAIITFRNLVVEGAEPCARRPGNELASWRTRRCGGAESPERSRATSKSATQDTVRDDSPVLLWLGEHAGNFLSVCQKGREGRTPLERLHGKTNSIL